MLQNCILNNVIQSERILVLADGWHTECRAPSKLETCLATHTISSRIVLTVYAYNCYIVMSEFCNHQFSEDTLAIAYINPSYNHMKTSKNTCKEKSLSVDPGPY